jgi:hypothetical protein
MFWKKKSTVVKPENEKLTVTGSEVDQLLIKATIPAPPVQIFSEKEIYDKIVGLTEPGSTVYFYLSGSPAAGGPLGRGAAVVEVNPAYPGKKQKKYNVYVDDVNVEQLAGKKQRLFDSDSPKEIAQWIKDRHYKTETY